MDCLGAAIRGHRHPDWLAVKIRDLSLFGFGIHAPNAGLQLPSFRQSEEVELKIAGPWAKEVILPCEVKNCHSTGDGLRMGLERTDLRSAAFDRSSPAGEDYLLDSSLALAVRIANPFLYEEWGEATLVGFTSEKEWIFESADSSLLLFPRVLVRVHFDLPLETDGESSGIIQWARAQDGNRVRFGVRWTDLSFHVCNAVGEHMLLDPESKPKDLLKYGIQLKQFREQLKFSFISTREEYSQVLELRREAYVLAGKRPPDSTPEDLAIRCDGHSRILGAFHGQSLVASVSLTFAKDEATSLRSEGEFPDKTYPVPLPPKVKLLEIHSLCTRKEYRGGDLIRGVFEHIGRCLLLSDRDYLITFSTSDMWPLYKKLGFRKVGASVGIKALNGLEHHLILLHRNALIFGANESVASWNYFFSSLVSDLREKGFLELSVLQALRVSAMSLFGSLVRKRLRKKLEREFQAFMEISHSKESARD